MSGVEQNLNPVASKLLFRNIYSRPADEILKITFSRVYIYIESRMDISDFPNFYQILGVESNASLSEVKQRYHQLSLKYHPDKNLSANDDFLQVKLAYKVLSDPSLKQHYDLQYVTQANHSVTIHDQVSLDELEFDGYVYELTCRCGGSFKLCKELIELSLTKVCISCDTCSLCISVTLP